MQSFLPVCLRTRALVSLSFAAFLAACGGGAESESERSTTQLAAVAEPPPLVLRARGTLAGNVGPMVSIRVAGKVVASVEVRATQAQDYSFPVPMIAKDAMVDVVFTNDALVGGVDRNLYVEFVKINGVAVGPADAGVTYDRGAGSAAFDGLDVIKGQSVMGWNGALRIRAPAPVATGIPATLATTALDAWRLADQASFGATESLIAQIRQQGPAPWIAAQMALPQSSRYTLGNGDAIHRTTDSTNFCDQPAYKSASCWQDWFSGLPLLWDFYRNATRQPDQLRQRVAFALQQTLVVSELEVPGTYGLRNYHNAFLDNAFGNYRDVLKKVILSPVMGDYLDHVNNDRASPNENFGRELLQLFSIGTCRLNADGSLEGGACQATYDNEMVRNYAYALTGWTYPAGGVKPWGCWPRGANCQYYGGDMVPFASSHDTSERQLLSGFSVPSGSSSGSALEVVLDSLMAHPSMAPFLSRRFIQHLVTSNPTPAYVQRVSNAFTTGRFVSGGASFGAGRRGDLAATVAAILLDSEARTPGTGRSAGKLREPALFMAGVLRALNGTTDGDALNAWWGEALRQRPFRPPSVFNFYPPDYPVSGTTLVGPAFGIHNANAALSRLNYLTFLLYWDTNLPRATVPDGTGTKVDVAAFQTDAGDAGTLVDRLSVLALGQAMPSATRQQIVAAVETIVVGSTPTWKADRVKQAAFLVFASPEYQISR